MTNKISDVERLALPRHALTIWMRNGFCEREDWVAAGKPVRPGSERHPDCPQHHFYIYPETVEHQIDRLNCEHTK